MGGAMGGRLEEVTRVAEPNVLSGALPVEQQGSFFFGVMQTMLLKR